MDFLVLQDLTHIPGCKWKIIPVRCAVGAASSKADEVDLDFRVCRCLRCDIDVALSKAGHVGFGF